MSAHTENKISSRRQLFDYLQSQMQSSYSDIKEHQKIAFESNLIKSYILEVNTPCDISDQESVFRWFKKTMQFEGKSNYKFDFIPTEESGFYQLVASSGEKKVVFFLDAATDSRFWLGYSISESLVIDRCLEYLVRNSINFDFVWLWPNFLEEKQKRGEFRGFGLDYDYRKFEQEESEITTYLKMQLWGGANTHQIYELLRKNEEFTNKVVLSKIRFKEFEGVGERNSESFAIQDLKYNGKFTTRGTDLNIHLRTLNDVRLSYKKVITSIENDYSLKWVETKNKNISLEGYALHFIPSSEIQISLFIEKVFDGTAPFRLLGYPISYEEKSAAVEIVDLHTGGKISVDLYPDRIIIYIPDGTCGNSIARFYTNLQHYFDVRFEVETDNGEKLFN